MKPLYSQTDLLYEDPTPRKTSMSLLWKQSIPSTLPHRSRVQRRAEQTCLRPALSELVGPGLHLEVFRRAGRRLREEDPKAKL